MSKLTLYSFLLLLANSGILLIYLIVGVIFQNLSYTALSIMLLLTLLFFVLFALRLTRVQAGNKKEGVQFLDSLSQTDQLTVVLTAYNDELSIHEAVLDFKEHRSVKRVIVISNNSKDRTMEFAESAGAIVYNESNQGYGACVHRALVEGSKFTDTQLTLLCEGDQTFRAYDIDKFFAYLPHADIVSGTRIVAQLRSEKTQLTNFMYYGNFFVGKLLELKHISNGTFTDVGTTYKLCRNESLHKLLPTLDNTVNLEFNPYFLDKALQQDLAIVECPITFHPRVGESKGGNINNFVAFKLGIRMMVGIIFKW